MEITSPRSPHSASPTQKRLHWCWPPRDLPDWQTAVTRSCAARANHSTESLISLEPIEKHANLHRPFCDFILPPELFLLFSDIKFRLNPLFVDVASHSSERKRIGSKPELDIETLELRRQQGRMDRPWFRQCTSDPRLIRSSISIVYPPIAGCCGCHTTPI